jgi:polysaccharide export outer membrane protein
MPCPPLLAATPSASPGGLARTTPLASSTALDTDLYVLGPGDVLQLSFLDPTAASVGGGLSILPDGTATLALLGSVQLTGLTIGQATRWLTSLYSRQLLRPQLFLTLTTPRPVKVSVLGEVQRPGLYPLTTGTNPVAAIQAAGGITLNADVRNVLLRRRLSGPDGNQKQTILNLAELLQFGNQNQNPLLFDGDTLVIARTNQPLPDEVLQLAASNLSPATINVTVIGEVKSPGTLSLRSNTPLVEAILKAGGPTDWRANTGNVELVRLNRNGTTTREVFKLNYNKGVSNGLNPPLRDNDTVVVNRSVYGKSVDVLNQVVLPLSQLGNFWSYYWRYNNN